jgi:predicted ribosomally synthesized peptide with nif11-like leader
MKTLREFIQRLQDDPAFEKQAQIFDNGEDLMAFVKSEGYDFTLEQLASEFKQEAKPPPDTGGGSPAPEDANAPTPPRPDDEEFLRQPEAVPQSEKSSVLLQSGNDAFTREQTQEELSNPPGGIHPAGSEEESPGGILRGGGGRHRGFSPQRLKSMPEEEA